jgi:hypothetical protein
MMSLCKHLQTDVSHGSCVADNVASTGEEQVEMLAQFRGGAKVERDVGTAGAFFSRNCRTTPVNGLPNGQQRL